MIDMWVSKRYSCVGQSACCSSPVYNNSKQEVSVVYVSMWISPRVSINYLLNLFAP